MSDHSKVVVAFGQSEMVMLMRFFNRGVQCAYYNHSNFSSPISTYGCDVLSKKLAAANKEMKIKKAQALIAKAEGKDQ